MMYSGDDYYSDDITSGNYETVQCYALRHVTSGANPCRGRHARAALQHLRRGSGAARPARSGGR